MNLEILIYIVRRIASHVNRIRFTEMLIANFIPYDVIGIPFTLPTTEFKWEN